MLRFVQRSAERNWFPRPENMPEILHRLLMQRGIASAEEAEAFLRPSETQLRDPFLLSDMRAAVDRIRAAVERGEHICVYGDYDVDGVCASAILATYFEEIDADYEVYLPSRHSEGYGLNEDALRIIAERAKLLVTVDCGIASHDLITLAKSLGLDCVVTDHHRPGDALPDCTVINPLLNEYPFPCLCGAGVAFKLVWALGGRDAAMARVDLAAIATVADVVALRDENRAIVHLGLKAINENPRPGVRALMEAARLEAGQVTAESVGFRLAPRLNAGGRLGSAQRSFDLLIERDAFLAISEADELEQENARRQAIEREIRAEAERQITGFDFGAHRILLVRGEGWNPGVIGLTASHLREKYSYPVIALSESDGVMVGSCRSIEGVDIFQTLSSAAHLMEKFGGHAQAAGLTVKSENFDALWAALDRYLMENVSPEAYLPQAQYDLPASLGDFTEPFVRALSSLEPTGCSNPEPVFRAKISLLEARAIGAQGAHLRLIAAQNGARRTGIYFGAGASAAELGDTAEILFTPQLNVWNGRTDVQLRLCALRESDTSARIAAAKAREDVLQRAFLTEIVYNEGQISHEFPKISLDSLKARFARNPQGTWVFCADAVSAEAVLAAANPCAPDLSVGKLPSDARGFNAVVLCPDTLRELPPAVRTIVFVGIAPVGLDGKEVLSLELPPAAIDLPDVDALREVYRACVHLSRRPAHLPELAALTDRLSQESGVSSVACHLCVRALEDMRLIELYAQPFSMRLPPMKKTDPASSAVWRAIQDIKRIQEGRD